jgi:hypothetical protein
VPAVTMAYGRLTGKAFSSDKVLSVGVVVLGVACSCYGDMSYTAEGFLYTAACVVLAATKVVASGEMMAGANKMAPLVLLGTMAPLACVTCLALSLATGEVAAISSRWATELSPFVNPAVMGVVAFSGLLSFTLNISSLVANKKTSPLTLCIAANVKQVLMLSFSTLAFGTEISLLNGIGIVTVLLGSARYSWVSVLEKEKAAGSTS